MSAIKSYTEKESRGANPPPTTWLTLMWGIEIQVGQHWTMLGEVQVHRVLLEVFKPALPEDPGREPVWKS